MLIRQTPAGPGYNMAVQAGRAAKKRAPKNQSDRGTVSMCINKMLIAGCNPFAPEAQGACIPDGNTSASTRSYVRRQITLTIGTGGVGFCHFMVPCTTDATGFVYTEAAFAGVNTQFLSADNVFLPGISVSNVALPITRAQLSTGLSSSDERPAFSTRTVAAGFSFRYTGKEIDRAGQAYVYVHPAHNSSASSYGASGTEVVYTTAQLAAFPETMMVECSRQETFIPLFPVSDLEMEYAGESNSGAVDLCYPWSGGAQRQPGGFQVLDATLNPVGIPIATFMVFGTAGSTYTVNYGHHAETIGYGTIGYAKMPAESDSVGVQDILAAYPRFAMNRVREPGVAPLREFKQALSSVQRDRGRRVAL